MSLVVNLESLQGLGAVGDRVARVIFRGNEERINVLKSTLKYAMSRILTKRLEKKTNSVKKYEGFVPIVEPPSFC